MNKIKKIILAALGGVDVALYTITPILLAIIWVNLFGLGRGGDYIIYIVGLLSSVFRGIKIGWLRNG
jgi:hypothetical protein